MSSSAAALITANTYLHDAAVTLLAACGLVLFIAVSRTVPGVRPETISNLISLRRRLSPIVIGSLAVITVGAIPRILFFGSFEYARAAERLGVPVLIARHVLALVVLIAGVSFWNSGSRLIKQLSSAAAGRKD